jgi:hypothetical protein
MTLRTYCITLLMMLKVRSPDSILLSQSYPSLHIIPPRISVSLFCIPETKRKLNLLDAIRRRAQSSSLCNNISRPLDLSW